MNTDSEDYYQSLAGDSETILFPVLCMHDFEGEDAGLLSFKKNEILDVVKRDDTGWWAAMRQEGPVVGWIPQAYVSPLTEEMAGKLRNTWEEVRIYEYEAEQLYNSVPVNHNLALFDDPESAASSPRPEYEDYKVRWVTIYLQLAESLYILSPAEILQHTKFLEIYHKATQNETRTSIPTIHQIPHDGVHNLPCPPLLQCHNLQCVLSRNGTLYHQLTLKMQKPVEYEVALCQVRTFVEDH